MVSLSNKLIVEGSLKRYLFYYGYIGTRFSGVQRSKLRDNNDTSLSKYLEDGLKSLYPLNDPIVIPSSRTDAGVHAICSTFQCDLSFTRHRRIKIFENLRDDDEYIKAKLNLWFRERKLDIRIHKTQIVPFSFNCRYSAIQRTYLYRLAVRKRDKTEPLHSPPPHYPISELNRCYFLETELDITTIKKACELLKGIHDFRHFCKITKENRFEKTTRTLNDVFIAPGRPFFNPVYDTGNEYENLQFWDIICTGRSFLRNQVRRIVAYLIAIGEGKVQLDELRAVLADPSIQWNHSITIADACGLYLLNVKYPAEAFFDRPIIQFEQAEVEE